MHNLSTYVDGATDIVPSADLSYGQDVARLENHVRILLAGQRAADRDGTMFGFHMVTTNHRIAGEIGVLLVGIALEAAGKTKQVGCRHAFRKRIFARPEHLAIDRNLGR